MKRKNLVPMVGNTKSKSNRRAKRLFKRNVLSSNITASELKTFRKHILEQMIAENT